MRCKNRQKKWKNTLMNIKTKKKKKSEEKNLKKLSKYFAGTYIQSFLASDKLLAGFVGQTPQPEKNRAEDHSSSQTIGRHPDIANLKIMGLQIGSDVIQPAKYQQNQDRHNKPFEDELEVWIGDEADHHRIKQKNNGQALSQPNQPALLHGDLAEFHSNAQKKDYQQWGQYIAETVHQFFQGQPGAGLRWLGENGGNLLENCRKREGDDNCYENQAQLSIKFRAACP